MATLDKEELEALNHTRQRLLNLQNSLSALQQDLFAQQPLPSWSALQSHTSLIATSLGTISDLMSKHHDLLSSLSVYPLPQFPGRTQEHILQQMLRVKLEPDVQEWVEQGQAAAQPPSTAARRGLSQKDLSELWDWAPGAANDLARKQKWRADYSLAEKERGVETVVTGLQRELEEPPDDDPNSDTDEDEEADAEDDDAMDIVEADRNGQPGEGRGISNREALPQMPLESVHRFMTMGKVAG